MAMLQPSWSVLDMLVSMVGFTQYAKHDYLGYLLAIRSQPRLFWYWLGDMFGFLNGIFAQYLETQGIQCSHTWTHTKYPSSLVHCTVLTFMTQSHLNKNPEGCIYMSTGMGLIHKTIKPAVLIGLHSSSSSLVTCTEPFNYLQPSPLCWTQGKNTP